MWFQRGRDRSKLSSINLQGKKEVDFIGSVYFGYATFDTHYQRQTEGEERFWGDKQGWDFIQTAIMVLRVVAKQNLRVDVRWTLKGVEFRQ